mgnify:FL=1
MYEKVKRMTKFTATKKKRSEMDEKKRKFALASFVRCNPQMKVFRKCYAITLIPTLFPIYTLVEIYVKFL